MPDQPHLAHRWLLRSRCGSGPVLVWLRYWAARLFATTTVQVIVLRHHDFATEDADDLAVLVVADRFNVDDATIVFGLRFPFVQDGRFAIQRVAVEGRRDVAQRFHFEVRDGLARDIGNAHAKK